MEKNILNNILPDDKFFLDLPDCICEASDYKEKIEKSFALTDSILVMDSFESKTVGKQFVFDLIVNGQVEHFSFDITSDFVNGHAMTQELNQILIKNSKNENRKFIAFSGDYVDFCIAFLTDEQELQLKKERFIFSEEYYYPSSEEPLVDSDFDIDSNSKIEDENISSYHIIKKKWWQFWK